MAPLFSTRIPDAQPQPVQDQAVLAAGVDDDLGARTSRIVPSSRLIRDADGAVALEQHVEHARAFVDVDAVLARVVEHHLVELAAHHLPGLRALVRLVVPEVERRRQLAVRVDELHAVLLDEVALLHLRQHVEPLQHPVGLGNQRLADVKARKLLALEQLRRDSPAGRAAWRPWSRPARRRSRRRPGSGCRPDVAHAIMPSAHVLHDEAAGLHLESRQRARLDRPGPARSGRAPRAARCATSWPIAGRSATCGGQLRSRRPATASRRACDTVDRNSTTSGKRRTTASMPPG